MKLVDNGLFGTARRHRKPNFADLDEAVQEGFMPGAYAAQLVRGAPGDPVGHGGLAGWAGALPDKARPSMQTRVTSLVEMAHAQS